MPHLRVTLCAFTLGCLSACAGERAFDPAATSPRETAMTAPMVVTPGTSLPTTQRVERPNLATLSGDAFVVNGGQISTVALGAKNCANTSATLRVTFSVQGALAGSATFRIPTAFTYDGGWTGTNYQSATATAQTADDLTTFNFSVTLTNVSAGDSDAIPPLRIVPERTASPGNSVPPEERLNIDDASAVVVDVTVNGCTPPNAPPVITVPQNLLPEAEIAAANGRSAGANVSFAATAFDAEDNASAAVSCSPASGAFFAIDVPTTVMCSASDSKGASASKSFTVTVRDTRGAAFTSFPTSPVQLIATSQSGAVFDVARAGIAAADINGISEPSTFACAFGDGTAIAGSVIPIGSTRTVVCTPKDARGNVGVSKSFDVSVGLNVASGGNFLPPLRIQPAISAHKLGSAIPHKFAAPTYANGARALDLAAGLRFTITQTGTSIATGAIDATTVGTGSSSWTVDADGNYQFNVKTTRSAPWSVGTYRSVVSYNGIVLASTLFTITQ